jgi:hypothetical protein
LRITAEQMQRDHAVTRRRPSCCRCRVRISVVTWAWRSKRLVGR